MILKLLGTKPTESIHIGRKNDDGSYTPLEKNALAGRITDAKLKDFEWKGEKWMALDIRFEYKGKAHILNCGKSKVALSIANCILGASQDELENFHLSVYNSKKTGYNSVTCRHLISEEKIKWALSIDEQNALVEKVTKKSGEVIKDDTELLLKFQSLLNEKVFPVAQATGWSMENALDFLDDAPAPAIKEEASSVFSTDDLSIEDIPY